MRSCAKLKDCDQLRGCTKLALGNCNQLRGCANLGNCNQLRGQGCKKVGGL